MPNPRLSRERIAEIKQAFIDAQMLYSAEMRGLLMNGINPQYVATLRRYSSDQQQLAGDLNSLNSVERLADGTIPLRSWLENASDAFAPRTEASVFLKALEELLAVPRQEPAEPLARRSPSAPPPPAPAPESTWIRKGVREIKESLVSTTARDDIVNLGFSPATEANNLLPTNEALKCSESYYLWFNIGRALKQSIGAPQPLYVENLPTEAHLTIALFAFDKELEITPGEDIGELTVKRNPDPGKGAQNPVTSVTVRRQPCRDQARLISFSATAAPNILDRFLFFPVRTPKKEGTFRLRCNIYCGQVLVQSHLISAQVMLEFATSTDAVTSKVDYALSKTLRPEHLAAIEAAPHRLSLMINSNGDGSHNFRFLGSDGAEVFKADAQVDGPQLGRFLDLARAAMKRVSWGNKEEWGPDNKGDYRYREEKFDSRKLALDLAYLAREGWRIYAAFEPHLKARNLEKIMAESGQVQIALKLAPKGVLPAAAVYDYAWAPELRRDFDKTEFQLCSTFSDALANADSAESLIEHCPCFKGACDLKSKIEKVTKEGSIADLEPIICPSGFWGYRHELGFPLTLEGADSEVPPVINFSDVLNVAAGVSTDPDFQKRDPHLARLKAFTEKLHLQRSENYRDLVKSWKSLPHLLYFYCHGGVMENSDPYLEIGAPNGNDFFLPATVRAEGLSWQNPHPLVFINGCHTTALNPEITLDFVSSFVQQAGASGVIGTEITIFEELAVKFAEECLRRFLGVPPFKEPMPIGQAVRAARLELLRSGNPLGLVYIPFAMSSLRLQQVSAN